MTTLNAAGRTADPTSLRAALLAGKKVPPDITNLLAEDHRTVLGWFDWYDDSPDRLAKKTLRRRICAALAAHMQGEEELVYPEAQAQIGDSGLIQRAAEEHARAKDIIAALESGEASEDADRRMGELRSEVESHVHEEESQLFPEMRRSALDLYELGRSFAAGRAERLQQLSAGAPPTGRPTATRL